VIGWRLRDEPGARELAKRAITLDYGEQPFSRASVMLSATGTVLLIAVGPAFASWHDQRPVVADASVITNQLAGYGWTRSVKAPWHPEFNADLALMTTLAREDSDGGQPIDVAVEYFARNRQGRSILGATNHLWNPDQWHLVEAHQVSAHLGSRPALLNESVIAAASEQRLVWWSYWIDGRYTTSGVTVKLLQFKTALTGHEMAALVAFSTPIVGTVENARARLEHDLAALPAGERPKADGQQARK